MICKAIPEALMDTDKFVGQVEIWWVAADEQSQAPMGIYDYDDQPEDEELLEELEAQEGEHTQGESRRGELRRSQLPYDFYLADADEVIKMLNLTPSHIGTDATDEDLEAWVDAALSYGTQASLPSLEAAIRGFWALSDKQRSIFIG